MYKFLATSLLGLLCCASVLAQNNQTITGKLTDSETNQPLSGARIAYAEGKLTTTNEQGNFILVCDTGEVNLKISYIGYTSLELTAGCGDNLNIALTVNSSALDEIQLSGQLDQQDLKDTQAEVTLNQRELKRGTGLFLDDAINANVPGVIMQRRAVSSGQQFNIRGYGNGVGFRGANNNFDTQGTKIYLNGIPLTDAEGITALDDIDFASIGKVDVLKGPAGTRYGFAIAGAIELTSIQPAAGTSALTQKITAGRFGLLRTTTQLQLGYENSALLVNYGHQESDGFMDHNNSQKDFVNAIWNYQANSRQRVSAYFGYSNSYDERGGELTIEQYAEKDYSGNARYIKNNAHSEIISFRAGLTHEYDFNNWLKNKTTLFGTGMSTNASSAGGWTDKNPLNYGLRSVFDLNFAFGENVELSGSAGVELQEQRAVITGYSMVENPDDPEGYNIIGGLKSNQFAQSTNSHLFTEWTLQLPEDFSITAGLGLSAMHIDLEDRLYNADSDKERNVMASYKNLYSPRVAVNKVFNDAFSAYASFSKAYKAPVSGNIVISTTGELNTGLVPEEGTQFEFGSNGNLLQGKMGYQLAFFSSKFKNKFTSVAVPLDASTTGYTYIANGGSQNHKGVEALLNYRAYESATGFFRSILPYANVTYSDFTYTDYQYERLNSDGTVMVSDYSGNVVAGVSPWVVNAGVDYQLNSNFYGTITYQYRDAMPFTSDGINTTDAFSLLNAKLGYRTSFGQFDLDAFVGADNLTGTQYYYMVFVNQLADAYIPAPYEVNYYSGVSLSYKF